MDTTTAPGIEEFRDALLNFVTGALDSFLSAIIVALPQLLQAVFDALTTAFM